MLSVHLAEKLGYEFDHEYFMSTAFFVFGLCQAITGFMALMLLRREEEKVKDSP